MSDAVESPMDVEAFLVWAEGREGKWELHDGRPVCLAPERTRHSLIKTYAAVALLNAVRRAGAACAAFAEGPTVRVKTGRAFIPDACVVCPPPASDALEISNPLIVVEVLSPSTAAFDHGAKLEAYFTLPSLAHCLILDPDRNVLIHHSRGREGVIETHILHEGEVRLDPPGIGFAVAELFGG